MNTSRRGITPLRALWELLSRYSIFTPSDCNTYIPEFKDVKDSRCSNELQMRCLITRQGTCLVVSAIATRAPSQNKGRLFRHKITIMKTSYLRNGKSYAACVYCRWSRSQCWRLSNFGEISRDLAGRPFRFILLDPKKPIRNIWYR